MSDVFHDDFVKDIFVNNIFSGPKASQRPERAPIKLNNSFLPKPPQQAKQRFSTPPRNFARQSLQQQSQPILKQQVLQRKDGQQRQAVNVNKLKAVTDLESEIGEVIDGLTELAERFPDDFTSLMDTFHDGHHPHHPHGAANKAISPMDILNLANMITQVSSVGVTGVLHNCQSLFCIPRGILCFVARFYSNVV